MFKNVNYPKTILMSTEPTSICQKQQLKDIFSTIYINIAFPDSIIQHINLNQIITFGLDLFDKLHHYYDSSYFFDIFVTISKLINNYLFLKYQIINEGTYYF